MSNKLLRIRQFTKGLLLTVEQYRWQLPNRDEFERDIVERPESVIVLLVGQKGICRQVQVELCEVTGFRAGRFEKLLDFYSYLGSIAHKAHLLVDYDLEWTRWRWRMEKRYEYIRSLWMRH